MELKIFTLTNKIIKIEVDKRAKIFELKKLISKKENLKVNLIKLLNDKNVFENDKELNYYDIKEDSKIYLLIYNYFKKINIIILLWI